MRKSISSIFTVIFGFIIFMALFIGTSAPVSADPYRKGDDDDFKILPVTLCNFLGTKCDDTKNTPDPNQPTPPHPTPEIMPTAVPPVPGACAPRGGAYLCGSRSTPRANCGHCGLNYNPYEKIWSCNFKNRAETWGTAYAIDISMSPGQAILLPSIEGQSVSWYHSDEKRYITNAIQRYQGIANEKTYILQFHHTRLSSGIGLKTRAQSGQPGGRVCPTCDHVHIQISQDEEWKDATKYYCN